MLAANLSCAWRCSVDDSAVPGQLIGASTRATKQQHGSMVAKGANAARRRGEDCDDQLNSPAHRISRACTHDDLGAVRREDDMNGDGDDWAVEPEPADERVLHGRPGTERDGRGTTDYAEAVTTRDADWWAALSDYERRYGVLRALESACERGAPLHLARC